MFLASKKIIFNKRQETQNIILQTSVPGEGNIFIQTPGLYEITAIGAGGGCAALRNIKKFFTANVFHSASSSGGSGCVFKGNFELESKYYNYNIGKLGNSSYVGDLFPDWINGQDGRNSFFSDLVSVEGGKGGKIQYNQEVFEAYETEGGKTISYDKEKCKEIIINSIGNNGTSKKSTSSNISTNLDINYAVITGYGAGSGCINNYDEISIRNGTNGFLQIKYLRPL